MIARSRLLPGILAAVLCGAALADQTEPRAFAASVDDPADAAVDLAGAELDYDGSDANYDNDPQGVMSGKFNFGGVLPKMPAQKAAEHNLQQIDRANGDTEDDYDEDDDEDTTSGATGRKSHATQAAAQKHEPQAPELDEQSNDVAQDAVQPQNRVLNADSEEEHAAPQHAVQTPVRKHQTPNPAPGPQSNEVAKASLSWQKGGPDADPDEDDDAIHGLQQRVGGPNVHENGEENTPAAAVQEANEDDQVGNSKLEDDLEDPLEAARAHEELDDSNDDNLLEVSAQGAARSFRHGKPKKGAKKKDAKKDTKKDSKKQKKKDAKKQKRKDNSTKAQGPTFVFRQKVSGSTPTGTISLGTPPVEMNMILDTGSDRLLMKTWQTFLRLIERVDVDAAQFVTPTASIYNHDTSASYVALYSNESDDTSTKTPKQGFIQYGSGMAYTLEGEDTVTLDNINLSHFPVAEISDDSLSVLHSTKNLSGILGLQHMGNQSRGVSFFSKMRDQGSMTAFGYCRGDNDDGTFIWGDSSQEGSAVEVVGEMHWAVSITDFHKKDKAGQKDASDKDSEKKKLLQDSSSLLDLSDGVDLGDVVDTGRLDTLDRKLSNLLRQEGDGSDSYLGGLSDPLEKLKKIIKKLEHRQKKRHSDYGEEARYKEPKKEEFKPTCKKEGDCVAVIDTGSNIIAMPTLEAELLRESLNVSRDCSNLADLPDLHFKLGDFSVTIPGEDYVMKVKMPGLPGVDGTDDASSDDEDDDATGALVQQDSSASSAHRAGVAKLKSMLKETLENHGVDLRSMFPGEGLAQMLKMLEEPTTVCMAAVVGMDRNTTKGALYVVGTPLMNKYYTRWSWAKDDKTPKIFVQEKSKADSCKEENTAEQKKKDDSADGWDKSSEEGSGKMVVMRDHGKKSAPVMRSENLAQKKRKSEALHQVSFEPREIDLKDIRFPHWAKNLKFL